MQCDEMAEEYCWATTELCFSTEQIGVCWGLGSNCDWNVFSMQFKMYSNVRLVPDVRERNCCLSRVEGGKGVLYS